LPAVCAGAVERELTMIGTRTTLVWGTAAAAIASAALLASSGANGPRVASLVNDVMRARPPLGARTGAPGLPTAASTATVDPTR
jgi:hypothetical protein